jgi:ADP-heptose:LPS heptosyltransferase
MLKTSYTKINAPLCQDMINKVSYFLKLPRTITLGPQPLMTLIYEQQILQQKLMINPNQKYLLFNPYIDSGSYLMTKRDIKKLFNYAKVFAQSNNLQIILTGTQKERDRDYNNYDLIDLDLRGKTTVKELFLIMQFSCIEYYIGFDGLLLHLSNMYSKSCKIRVRRSTSIKWGSNIMLLLKPYPNHNKQDLLQLIRY